MELTATAPQPMEPILRPSDRDNQPSLDADVGMVSSTVGSDVALNYCSHIPSHGGQGSGHSVCSTKLSVASGHWEGG